MKSVNNKKKYRYLKHFDENIDNALLLLGLGKSSCRWFNPLYNLLSALAFSVLSHCMLTIRKSPSWWMMYGFIHSRRSTVARTCFLLSVDAAAESFNVSIHLGVDRYQEITPLGVKAGREQHKRPWLVNCRDRLTIVCLSPVNTFQYKDHTLGSGTLWKRGQKDCHTRTDIVRYSLF